MLAYRRAHAKAPDYDLAQALNSVAILHADLGHVDVALDYFRQSVAMHEELYGPDNTQTRVIEGNLAEELRNGGRTLEARALLEKLVAENTRLLGKDDLRVASVLTNLARANSDLGAVSESIPQLRRAIEMKVKGLGPDSPALLTTRVDLSKALLAAGEVDEALAEADRALALIKDPKDLRRIGPLTAVGRAYGELGRCSDAIKPFDEAATIAEASRAPTKVAELASNRVECDLETGRAAATRKAIEAAVLGQRALLGDRSHFFANYLAALAQARLASGEPSAALAPAEQALSILVDSKVVGYRLVRAQLVLAQVLWEARPDERARASELARTALANAQPLRHTKAVIEHWLSTH